MSSISQKPLDSKREEFRKYLERTGVMDGFTQVLTSLYEEPEKPEDALAYVFKVLQSGRPEKQDIAEMSRKLSEYSKKVKDLEELLAAEQVKVASLESQLENKGRKPVTKENETVAENPLEVSPAVDPLMTEPAAEEPSPQGTAQLAEDAAESTIPTVAFAAAPTSAPITVSINAEPMVVEANEAAPDTITP